MKAVLKLLLLPLALIVLFTRCEKEPDPVNIPDDAFLNALIKEGVDTNGDGLISSAEAEVVLTLDVSRSGISDITGIESFVNLEELDCENNELTDLDISNITSLKCLYLWGNQLTSLDVSNIAGLLILRCSWNQLTSLDVSENYKLKELRCEGNQLTTLDISNNSSLIHLICNDNQLTNLDVSRNSSLGYLACFRNFLTTLDFTNNYYIQELYCGENLLTHLDLSQQSRLSHLSCGCSTHSMRECERSNLLTSLDISNNINLRLLWLLNMPTLTQVCVWELPFPPLRPGNVPRPQVDTTGSPNVYFTTECSE